MRLELQVLGAMTLDLAVGDPRWLPHPVRWIGWLAAHLEARTRRWLPARAAGMVTWTITVGATAGSTWALVHGAQQWHPVAGDMVCIVLLWTTLALRSLAEHALDVARPLAAGDLPQARTHLARMVGRDTAHLGPTAIVRGAVESVAENTTDGVTAPLFYACLFGPVGAMAYKAVSTLDSMFGYRTERYLRFGWASARLDDLAAFVPARLTAPLMVLAAALLRLRPRGAARVLVRDGGRHPSPNAGLAEAAMAGALGVQLGGLNSYAGVPSHKPTLGDAQVPLARAHIGQAIRMMLLTGVLSAAAFVGLRWAGCALLRYGGASWGF